MNGKTHMFVATTVVLSIAIINRSAEVLYGLPMNPIALVPMAPVGGLKSDMDMEGNPSARGQGWMIKIAQKIPFLGRFFEHRGATHTGIIPVIGYMLAASLAAGGVNLAVMVLVSCILGWIIGYVSHIFIDTLNGKGTPCLWPVYWKRIHILNISTGTYQEGLFCIVWAVFIVSHTFLVLSGKTI